MIVIPLRVHPGQPVPFRPEEVVRQTGDVVFLEARDKEVYYIGGLLPPGEQAIPRDRDLDVVEAVVSVGGPLLTGTAGSNGLSGRGDQPGIGGPSPSLLVLLRWTPGGGQVPIRVDVNRALSDPRERILVKAGDLLVLQDEPGEALVRYFAQTFFQFTLNFTFLRPSHATGTITLSGP